MRCKCPVDGTRFRASEKYVYRRKKDGKELCFCRYNCMRAWDREQEEREKERVIRRQETVRMEREQAEVRGAQRRVEKCRERLACWRAKLERPGAVVRYKAGRETILKAVHEWEKKLAEAKAQLEQIERRREDDA